MPEILVLAQPEDEVFDRIEVSEDELGREVSKLFGKLSAEWSIEILYDDSPRSKVGDN